MYVYHVNFTTDFAFLCRYWLMLDKSSAAFFVAFFMAFLLTKSTGYLASAAIFRALSTIISYRVRVSFKILALIDVFFTAFFVAFFMAFLLSQSIG